MLGIGREGKSIESFNVFMENPQHAPIIRAIPASEQKYGVPGIGKCF